MSVDYVCSVNKDHPKKTFGVPQSQPPTCCSKPMTLAGSAPAQAASSGPGAKSPGAPTSKPTTPQRGPAKR